MGEWQKTPISFLSMQSRYTEHSRRKCEQFQNSKCKTFSRKLIEIFILNGTIHIEQQQRKHYFWILQLIDRIITNSALTRKQQKYETDVGRYVNLLTADTRTDYFSNGFHFVSEFITDSSSTEFTFFCFTEI